MPKRKNAEGSKKKPPKTNWAKSDEDEEEQAVPVKKRGKKKEAAPQLRESTVNVSQLTQDQSQRTKNGEERERFQSSILHKKITHADMISNLTPFIRGTQESRKHEKFLKKIKKIYSSYHSDDRKVFIESYWRILANFLCVKERNPFASSGLRFFEKMAITIGTFEDFTMYKDMVEQGIGEEENIMPFKRNDVLSHRVLRLCAKYCTDDRAHVRTKILEVQDYVIHSLRDANQLIPEVRATLVQSALVRLRDKIPAVRKLAANILAFFMLEHNVNPVDEEEIRKELYFSGGSDPNEAVRKICTGALTPKLGDISDFLKRLRDINESVRVAAYDVILKRLSLESFTVDERYLIVDSGINDPSESVRRKLFAIINEWLNSCGGNVIELLTNFDVIKQEDLCLLLLDSLFEEANSTSFDRIEPSFLVDKFIPLKEITEEKTFLWRYLFDRFTDDIYCQDKLMPPSMNAMIEYIYKYMDRSNEYIGEEEEDANRSMENGEGNEMDQIEQEVERMELSETNHGEEESSVLPPLTDDHDEELYRKKINYNLTQMLKILLRIPSEEGGRRELQKLIRHLFRNKRLTMYTVRTLIVIFFEGFTQESDWNINIAEILREALTSNFSYPEQAPPPKEVLSDKEIYALKTKLSEIMNKRIILKSQIDLAVAMKDFARAGALQEEFTKLSEEIKEIKFSLGTQDSLERPSTPLTVPDTQTTAGEGEDDIEMSQQAHYPTNSMKVVFGSLVCYLRKTNELNPIIKDFIDNLVPQAICNEDDELRQTTLKLLTIMGLMDTQEAHRVVIFALQALSGDNEITSETALRSLFDLVLHYGFDFFKDTPGLMETFGDILENDSGEEVSEILKNYLLSYFRSEDAAIIETVVKGTIRLLLGDRINAPNIVSTLLCTWVNPINEGSSIFYNIADFVSIYAGLSESKAQILAESFVPCIRRVLKGKRRGLLDEGCQVEKLINLIIGTTNPNNVTHLKNNYRFHLAIANAILTRILDRSGSAENIVFAKGLRCLNIDGSPKDDVLDLMKRVIEIKEDGVELRPVNSSLGAFFRYLRTQVTIEDVERLEKELDGDGTLVEEMEGDVLSPRCVASPALFEDDEDQIDESDDGNEDKSGKEDEDADHTIVDDSD